MSPTPFQQALKAGLESTKKLFPVKEAMKPLGLGFKITTEEDAQALAEALVVVSRREPENKLGSAFYELMQLLLSVGSNEAFEVLRAIALPVLEEFFDKERAAGVAGRDMATLLRLFGYFGRREGFDRIAGAIRANVECGWRWTMVFRNFPAKHPFFGEFAAIPLSDYPRNFVRVALVDHFNQLVLKGEIERHPFDCPDGILQLKEWLVGSDPEYYSYAGSAAVALAFVSCIERSELLALAMDHVSTNVQIEGAWAGVKVGHKGGIQFLARACTDAALFSRASKYLTELGHEEAIPESCGNEDFLAEANARKWLAHPNEFGRQPDEIRMFDTREIHWPPCNERRRVHLFRYRYKAGKEGESETLGTVMTGGLTTFSLSSNVDVEMAPEDVYAVHCCWELQMYKDPRAPKECTPEIGRAILGLKPE